MVRDNRHESAYLFGAICPDRAVGAAIIMPHVNADAMSEHLAEISTQVTPGAHAAVNGGRIPGQCSGAKAGHFVRGVMACTQAPDRGPGCKAAPTKRVRVG